MGARERGFTLIELVVAVGIGIVLLMAGGVWLLGMRPAALRNAADDFDANLAAARAIAGTSGNGATIAFLPRTGTSGFVMRVYSGRPTASGVVRRTSVMDLTSGATVSEATAGAPPFAIFLSSAGFASATGRYPNVAADGSVAFPAIARQPACPVGGIVLTFTSAQGASERRTLPCNTLVSGTSSADPSPTPNALKIVPSFMLAHWTTDAGPLHFIAAEFGYFGAFTPVTGAECQTIRSQTGAPPASYTLGWPQALPTGDPNDPPASFAMSPVAHDGGLCTVRIVDGYGQEADASVQVMGDLQSSASSLTFSSPTDTAQTVTFGKAFDAQALLMQAAASACEGVVSVTIPPPFTAQSAPSNTPTQATIVVSPVGAGSCTLVVGDQYGEPTIAIPIDVKALAVKTWPAELVLGVSGASVGTASGGSAACYAMGLNGAGVDSSLPMSVSSALGVYVDSSGCLVHSDGKPLLTTDTPNLIGMIAYTANGASVTYNISGATTCGPTAAASLTGWLTNNTAAQALLGAQGQSAGTCSVTLSDGGAQSVSADNGLVGVAVNSCGLTGGAVAVGSSCSFTVTLPIDICQTANSPVGSFGSDAFASWNGTILAQDVSVKTGPPSGDPTSPYGNYVTPGSRGTLTSTIADDGNTPAIETITFSRSAPGAATFYVYGDIVTGGTVKEFGGAVGCIGFYHLGGTTAPLITTSPTAVTVN